VVVVVAVHASSVVKKVTGLATAPIQAQVVVEEVGVVGAEALGVGVPQGMVEGTMVALQGMVVAGVEVGEGPAPGGGEQEGLLPLEPVTNVGNQAIGVLLAPTEEESC